MTYGKYKWMCYLRAKSECLVKKVFRHLPPSSRLPVSNVANLFSGYTNRSSFDGREVSWMKRRVCTKRGP